MNKMLLLIIHIYIYISILLIGHLMSVCNENVSVTKTLDVIMSCIILFTCRCTIMHDLVFKLLPYTWIAWDGFQKLTIKLFFDKLFFNNLSMVVDIIGRASVVVTFLCNVKLKKNWARFRCRNRIYTLKKFK